MSNANEALTARATADLLIAEAKLLVERGEAPNLPAGIIRAGLDLEMQQVRIIDRAKMLAIESVRIPPISGADVRHSQQTLRAVGNVLRRER